MVRVQRGKHSWSHRSESAEASPLNSAGIYKRKQEWGVIHSRSNIGWPCVDHCEKGHLLPLARQRLWLTCPSQMVRDWKLLHVPKWTKFSVQQTAHGTAALRQNNTKKPFENPGCDFFGPFQLKRVRMLVYVPDHPRNSPYWSKTCRQKRSSTTSFESLLEVVSQTSSERIVAATSVYARKWLTLYSQKIQRMAHLPWVTVLNKRTTWLFNPLGVPRMSGVWERFGASVRARFTKP